MNPATKIDESTFGVKVVVEPLDIFSLVDEDWDEGMAAYYDQYGDVDLSTLSEEAYPGMRRPVGRMYPGPVQRKAARDGIYGGKVPGDPGDAG